MPARVIDDFEFVWMLEGRAAIVTGEGERRLAPGHLLLVPPGVRHGFAWDDQRASRHGYVHFRPDVAPESVTVSVRRMTGRDPLAGSCAYLLWLGLERPEGWGDRSAQILAMMLGLIALGPLPEEDMPRALSRPLAASVEHLRQLWSEMPLRRVGVADLASAAGVSRSYLSRAFREEFGIGVAAGLECLRCSRAEPLLIRTDMTIGAIAHQCGFADLYHFSHRFTRRYGTSPSVFRRDDGSCPSVSDHPGVRRLANAVWG